MKDFLGLIMEFKFYVYRRNRLIIHTTNVYQVPTVQKDII